MTEAGIIQILTLLISAGTGLATLWFRWKISKDMGRQKEQFSADMAEHNDLDVAVDHKLDTVTRQNTQQSQKLDEVHTELNSRLDQWKIEFETRLATAVEAAASKAYQRGIEDERTRTEKKEEKKK